MGRSTFLKFSKEMVLSLFLLITDVIIPIVIHGIIFTRTRCIHIFMQHIFTQRTKALILKVSAVEKFHCKYFSLNSIFSLIIFIWR